MKQASSPAVSLPPAAGRAARMLADQMKLASDLDAALRAADEVRQRFEVGGHELQEFLRSLAGGAGFDPLAFEYQGAERLRLWIRSRGTDPGFAAIENRHLGLLKDQLASVEEITTNG